MDNEEQIVNVLESFLHDVMEEESTLDEIINVLGYNELKVLLKLAKKGLSDPIPLPTIKQGDKVRHRIHKGKGEVKEMFNDSKKAVIYWLEDLPTHYYANVINTEDLEVIENE